MPQLLIHVFAEVLCLDAGGLGRNICQQVHVAYAWCLSPADRLWMCVQGEEDGEGDDDDDGED